MTSIQPNYGLTAQGNQYQKSNTGKAAGATVGFALPLAATAIKLSKAKDCINFQNATNKLKASGGLMEKFATEGKLFTTQNLKSLGIVGCTLAATTIVGLALGNLYDKCVNKERMAQADGEAAREQRLAQNA